ncbi:MAG: hypothetical protein IJT01_04630 [Selenomonadaceae bacterium]|nr:hypothetical protein [Selenomonadaceae bacterium]
MSNPGVICLADVQAGRHRIRLEDNIGESIHLHLDGLRLDLTIEEFHELADKARRLMEELVEGVPTRRLDARFLLGMAWKLPELLEVRQEEAALESMSVEENGKLVPLAKCAIRTGLETGTGSAYPLLEGMRRNGGILWGTDIVLADGGGNQILDGKKRAACLHFLKGNTRLRVLVLRFQEGRKA